MFTSATAADASRKRKSRFPSERKLLEQKSRSTHNGVKKSKMVNAKANGMFVKSPHSGGANNVMGVAAVTMLVERLDEANKFTQDSVFVDFGCSAGGVCLFIAKRYGCKCYGIEKEIEPLQMAQEAAKTFGLSRICRFLEGDFTSEVYNSDWLWQIGATHVFAYDKVFSKSNWDILFSSIAKGPPLVGASCAVKRGCTLPDSFQLIGPNTKPAMLAGGKSGYSLRVWKNK